MIDPVIYDFGGFQIRWYSVLILVAVFIAYRFMASESKKQHIKVDFMFNLLFWALIFGIIGASCESIYAVTKAGIDGLTKSLAKEFAYSNIRVNSIAPGLIDTEMNSDLSEDDIKGVEEEIPLKRMGKPEEIVGTVKMLIENEYITGQVIEINGGWHM